MTEAPGRPLPPPHSFDIDGADHRFVGYEQLSVLVIFEKSRS